LRLHFKSKVDVSIPNFEFDITKLLLTAKHNAYELTIKYLIYVCGRRDKL